jgi:hypothetical protein
MARECKLDKFEYGVIEARMLSAWFEDPVRDESRL